MRTDGSMSRIEDAARTPPRSQQRRRAHKLRRAEAAVALLGYRPDVCPSPDVRLWLICGLKNSSNGHQCTPKNKRRMRPCSGRKKGVTPADPVTIGLYHGRGERRRSVEIEIPFDGRTWETEWATQGHVFWHSRGRRVFRDPYPSLDAREESLTPPCRREWKNWTGRIKNLRSAGQGQKAERNLSDEN
ncbi:hypothetical protein HPB50_011266 [Hyalomma asiaticum]|uniref:Uncharacterized protein n=1 Tax=Hyalomma asiaticum TaxID=266040 RepID=A0ACB7S8E3_HYAAI|nr:hypothetical protein HPB50_011266 [Hyalomma asiaticum]